MFQLLPVYLVNLGVLDLQMAQCFLPDQVLQPSRIIRAILRYQQCQGSHLPLLGRLIQGFH